MRRKHVYGNGSSEMTELLESADMGFPEEIKKLFADTLPLRPGVYRVIGGVDSDWTLTDGHWYDALGVTQDPKFNFVIALGQKFFWVEAIEETAAWNQLNPDYVYADPR